MSRVSLSKNNSRLSLHFASITILEFVFSLFGVFSEEYFEMVITLSLIKHLIIKSRNVESESNGSTTLSFTIPGGNVVSFGYPFQ